jgi:hypothetical protein
MTYLFFVEEAKRNGMYFFHDRAKEDFWNAIGKGDARRMCNYGSF